MNSRTWLVRARSVPLDHGGVRSKHRPMLVATNQRRQCRQREERTSRWGATIFAAGDGARRRQSDPRDVRRCWWTFAV